MAGNLGKGVDANELASRLGDEKQDYWLHIEAGGPLSKYPGEFLRGIRFVFG
jgi:hypothetical protein